MHACADCASIQAQNEFDLPFSDEDETGPHNKSQRLRGASQQSLTGGFSSSMSVSTDLGVTRLRLLRHRHMQSTMVSVGPPACEMTGLLSEMFGTRQALLPSGSFMKAGQIPGGPSFSGVLHRPCRCHWRAANAPGLG